MSGVNADESSTHGIQDTTPDDPDAEYTPGGSREPNDEPKEPGGTAATHHPPAE